MLKLLPTPSQTWTTSSISSTKTIYYWLRQTKIIPIARTLNEDYISPISNNTRKLLYKRYGAGTNHILHLLLLLLLFLLMLIEIIVSLFQNFQSLVGFLFEVLDVLAVLVRAEDCC
jgi:hypothetical protein